MDKTKRALPFCCVIAVGVNHDGSVAKAHKLIEEGAKAGADVIKFQTFVAKDIATKHARKQVSARNIWFKGIATCNA